MNETGTESAKDFFILYRLKYLRECYDSLLLRCWMISKYYKNKPQKVEELIEDIIKLNDQIQQTSLVVTPLPEPVRICSQAVVNTLQELNEKSLYTEEMISYIVSASVEMEDVLTLFILKTIKQKGVD